MASTTFTATVYNLWNNNFDGSTNATNSDLGRFFRSNGYVSELLCDFDVSSLAGANITGASLRFTITGSTGGEVARTVYLMEQNKTTPGDWSSPPIYDDFGNFPGTHTYWDTELSNVGTVLSFTEYTINDTSNNIRDLVQSWVDDSNDNWGVVLTRDDNYLSHYLTCDGTKIYLDVTFDAEVTSYGMAFDSANSEYLSSVSTFTKPTNGSVAFWIYLLETPGTNTMRVLGYNGAWELRFDTEEPGVISNDLNQFGSNNFNSVTVFGANQPYHVVCTYDSVGNGRILVNGVLDNTGTSQTGTPPTTGTLEIAHRTGASGEYLNAMLEDVRIYNRVLTDAECATIYACRGTDNIKHGLWHRWLLNEGPMETTASGAGLIKDLGEKSINMTPNNTPTFKGTTLKLRRFV